MLLAAVMLITSCSLSFFAFADDAAVTAANDAGKAALENFGFNTLGAKDQAFLDAINALSDNEVLEMNPVYYAYALHIVSNKLVLATDSSSNATKRLNKFKLLVQGNADMTANYRAQVKVPEDYIEVLKDLNAVNAQCADSAVTSKKPRMITDNNLNNLYFRTNTAAAAAYDAFWAKYKNYSPSQLLFADFMIMNSTNGPTNAWAAGNATNALKYNTDYSEFKDDLNFYFGARQGDRIADLYFNRIANPITDKNIAILTGKYIKNKAWLDATNGPSNFYDDYKAYFGDINGNAKAFYVQYFNALGNNKGEYEGAAGDTLALIIDTGLKLKADGDVDFAEIKAAYQAYQAISPTVKTVIAMVNEKVNALFNLEIGDADIKANVKFGADDKNSSVAWLAANPGKVAGSYATTGGIKLKALIDAVNDAYAEYLPLDEYEALLNTKLAQADITDADADEVWTAYNNLKGDFRSAVRASADLWGKTTTVMTAPFIYYVNAVNLNNVTAANVTESTERLNGLEAEFKTLVTTSDDFKAVYGKYQQIQIADFRSYVEGVELDNVSDENRTVATQKYNALADEFKEVVKADSTLYDKYLAILSSDFKDYVAGVDLNNVTDAIRTEAQGKYEALPDDTKKDIYENDAATWEKYCKIQVPAVDTNQHSEEAAKKADKVTLPSDSEAIKDLGIAKSIDNVEDFVVDDVLPLLTDKIKIKDKDDAVNGALEQYLTNATVGKVYSIYATFSHNVTPLPELENPDGSISPLVLANPNKIEAEAIAIYNDVDSDADAKAEARAKLNVKVHHVFKMLVPQARIAQVLYEEKYAAAQAKIAGASVPLDGEGNPEPVEIAQDEKGRAIYDDANVYDGIAALEFKSGDFGFADGDRDGVTDALLAALRPITALCNPGGPLGVEFFNHIDKKTGKFTFGIYECCVKLLEALGVTGLPTNDEYQQNYDSAFAIAIAAASAAGMTYEEMNLKATAIAGDEYLRPVIEGVFRLADSELKTIPDVLALIPRLGDLINSDVPSVVYDSLYRDLGMLQGLIENIDYQGAKVPVSVIVNKYVLPDALVYLINEKLLGDTGIELMMPDWDTLNKYTTFKVNKSAQKDKDYVAVRYINGDSMVSELLYYAYDNLIADDDNAEALKNTLGGLPLVGENIKPLVDNAKKAGKLATYAAILDYFYETEEEKSYDATADAGKSIGDAIKGINDTLNMAPIDCTNAVVKISRKRYNYNGKIQKPSVKVTLNGETLTKGIAYKVVYSKPKSKAIGTYKVTVKFIGSYEGADKTLKYTIGPKNAKKMTLTAKKGAVKVKWQKSASKACKGYQIKYSTNKSFKNAKTVTVKGRAKTAKTIKGLKSGKKYYVKIRAYAVKNGKKIYSTFSGKKSVAVK